MQPVLLPAEPSSNSCSQFLKSIITGPAALKPVASGSAFIHLLTFGWEGVAHVQ